MRQFNKEEAISIYESKIWEQWSPEDIVAIQLFQNRLLVPFDKFHEAIEKVLDRPVWTHEFADQNRMIEEYLGIRNKPTFEEILNLIPEDKLILIQTK